MHDDQKLSKHIPCVYIMSSITQNTSGQIFTHNNEQKPTRARSNASKCIQNIQ